MQARHRVLVRVVQTVFGLFMAFSGISGLLAAGKGMEGIPAPMVAAMQVLLQTGIFQMIKVTELVAGAMLVANVFPALAAIFIAPIAVGIIVFDLHVSPAYLPMGLIVCALNGYLGYVYWDKYKALFSRT